MEVLPCPLERELVNQFDHMVSQLVQTGGTILVTHRYGPKNIQHHLDRGRLHQYIFILEVTDKLQVSFEQLPVAFLQSDSSPLTVDLAPLEVKVVEEKRNGSPYLQVITNNLEHSHECDVIWVQLGRIQPKMPKYGHLKI